MHAQQSRPIPAAAHWQGSEKRSEQRTRAMTIVRNNASLTKDVIKTMSPDALWQMLYELRVDNVELEMKNEELLRRQAELAAVRSLYLDLFEQAPVGYCTVELCGTILQANLTLARLLGVEQGALINTSIADIVYRDDYAKYLALRKRALRNGTVQFGELRFKQSDGKPLSAYVQATGVLRADQTDALRLAVSLMPQSGALDAAGESDGDRLASGLFAS